MMTDRITQISASLERARKAVADGSKLDLEGLYAAVEAATKDAATAPLGERDALAAALGDLLKTLERLGADLARAHRGETPRRAAAAYGAPSGRTESET